VSLPPSIAEFYELLLDSQHHPFVFTTPEGHPWRRSNFRQRYWRPAWDEQRPGGPGHENHLPVVLPWFTFHEGRHTHATWMMKGIARVYDHVTPEMGQAILDTQENRWRIALAGLTETEQDQLGGWFPHVKQTLLTLPGTATAGGDPDGKNDAIAISSSSTH
jgi:integrase